MSETAPIGRASGDFLHESRITPTQGMILLLGVIISMLDGFDIQVIAYTAPAITADLGVTSQQMGLIFSAGLLGMTLGAMLLSPIADLYGRRIVVTVSLLLAGLTTAVIFFAQSVTELVIFRFLGGLVLGTLLSSVPTLVGEYSPRRHRTVIIATLFSGSALGAIIGGLITAAVIADYGWQLIFLVSGLLLMLCGVAFHLVVPESMAFIAKRKPEVALEKINRILSYVGQNPIDRLPAISSAESRESASVRSLLTPGRRMVTFLAWTTFFLGFATVYFLYSWIPQVLANAGLPQDQAIQGSVVVSVGALFGTVLIGWMGRWWRLSAVIASAFVMGAVVMGLFSTQLGDLHNASILWLWSLLFVLGLTASSAFSNLYTVALTVYPAQVRSTGLGWCIGLGRGGAVASPALAGVMLGMGVNMPTLFIYFAVPILIAAGCIYLIRMRELP